MPSRQAQILNGFVWSSHCVTRQQPFSSDKSREGLLLAFPKKTAEDDDDEETQEVTTSLAVSEININAAVATVLVQPDGSFWH